MSLFFSFFYYPEKKILLYSKALLHLAVIFTGTIRISMNICNIFAMVPIPTISKNYKKKKRVIKAFLDLLNTD